MKHFYSRVIVRRGIFFGFLFTLVVTKTVLAGGLETIIALPKEPVEGAPFIDFSVYVHNMGGDVAPVQFPAKVTCILAFGEQTVEAVATRRPPFLKQPTLIAKNGFAKGTYSFIPPPGLSGPVRMNIREFNVPSVMFATAPVEKLETESPIAEEMVTSEKYATIDALFTLYQPYLENLSAYDSMYFLVGANPEESKFQISFKYRFLDPEGDLAEKIPWLKGLHFGYTQTSFWDLESDSAPFEDTSYKPELLFLSSNIKKRPSWMQGFFLQTGIQHESNGRGGEFSRSTNYLYAKPLFILYDEKTRMGLQVAPKIWAYFNNDEDTNPDLEDYRGYFDLEVKLGKADSFVLESNLRWAEEGVSTEWNLTYPLHRYIFRHLGFYLQAQYVNTLAEGLINYQDRTEAFRLGLAVIR